MVHNVLRIWFVPLERPSGTPDHIAAASLFNTVFQTCLLSFSKIGLLVDSEIVLSTRYGKTMVFINKPLSTETAYQQDLINTDSTETSYQQG